MNRPVIKTFSKLVKIEYKDLFLKTNLDKEIQNAFGFDGLGLIVIKNPPKIPELRKKILKQGFNMANLPLDYLKTLEKPEIRFALGYGKGKAFTENEYEYLSAHFYARVFRDQLLYEEDPELMKTYTNIWPDEKLLPNFKEDYLAFGKALGSIQLSLLRHIDSYLARFLPGHTIDKLYNSFKDKNDAISRLIMYHPPDTLDSKLKASKDNWCGWHRDFGLLTGLTHALYYDKTGEIIPNVKSGLLVKDRKGEIHDLKFEEDEIVIQSGDVLFILSGGNIISTPHAVKIREGIPDNSFRITYVNFFEPYYSYKIFTGGNDKEIFNKDPFRMKDSFTKFKEGITYKDLISSAFDTYYS